MMRFLLSLMLSLVVLADAAAFTTPTVAGFSDKAQAKRPTRYSMSESPSSTSLQAVKQNVASSDGKPSEELAQAVQGAMTYLLLKAWSVKSFVLAFSTAVAAKMLGTTGHKIQALVSIWLAALSGVGSKLLGNVKNRSADSASVHETPKDSHIELSGGKPLTCQLLPTKKASLPSGSKTPVASVPQQLKASNAPLLQVTDFWVEELRASEAQWEAQIERAVQSRMKEVEHKYSALTLDLKKLEAESTANVQELDQQWANKLEEAKRAWGAEEQRRQMEAQRTWDSETAIQVQQAREELMHKHNQEMAMLRAEFQETIDHLQESKHDLSSSYEAKIEELKEQSLSDLLKMSVRHQEKKDELLGKQKQDMMLLKMKNANTIAGMRRTHAEEMQKIVQKHKIDMKELTQQHTEALKAEEEKYALALSTMQASSALEKLAEISSDFTQEIERTSINAIERLERSLGNSKPTGGKKDLQSELAQYRHEAIDALKCAVLRSSSQSTLLTI
mmetsp:Transcript_7551/g.11941  ORF Transcript_7551/g.11941 Transcript_7551/m.11941 type:complete len:504 (-) Transcript_7551:70-1581(-)|eukprot:CAMPEP_0184306970 /NCGR_PEP_ID=MMETSP1049-20130417/15831_1 /TAXON_ID=77928 /ORGANISM="Proteomonas sulcata, Strain CCMP704" /LENGTH=503 /DNA_ID=CAMNT_0026619349 /DNA_START=160 /DNA_END=1671 /DNA_ORIENTATION=-